MTDHDSIIICPCGLRFYGTPKEAHAMFRAHRCDLHEPEGGSAWPGVVALVACLVTVSFVCTNGWGLLT